MKSFFKYTFAPIANIVIFTICGFCLYCYNTIDSATQRLETYDYSMCEANRTLKSEIEYLESLNKAKCDILSGRGYAYTLFDRYDNNSITALRDKISATEKKIEILKCTPETYKTLIRETYRGTPEFLLGYIDFNRYALKANIASSSFDN